MDDRERAKEWSESNGHYSNMQAKVIAAHVAGAMSMRRRMIEACRSLQARSSKGKLGRALAMLEGAIEEVR